MSTRIRLLFSIAAATSLLVAAASGSPPTIPLDQLGAVATQQVDGDGLSIVTTANGARLRCAFQRLEGEVTAEGLWLRSTAAEGSKERFGVMAVGVGRRRSTPPGPSCGCRNVAQASCLCPLQGQESPKDTGRMPVPRRSFAPQELPTTGRVVASDHLARFLRPGLIEEYSVSVDGIRQDFLVLERPPGTGELCLELALTGAEAESEAQGVILTLADSRRTLAYSRLLATDSTGRELTARMEMLSSDRLALWVDDTDATYPIRIDPTISDADWMSMNPGMAGTDGWVRAMAVDANGHLYLGGRFQVAGTVAANHIAKWDGSQWSALGSGIDGEVCALATSGTDVYAGGTFTSAGGVAANSIGKWDGNEWSALGSGIQGEVPSGANDACLVMALSVMGTDLYAGGYFSSAGGVPASRVAQWDGSRWSALGSGIEGQAVQALAVIGSDLYVGGMFDTAGANPANNIAKWNGSSWSTLGSGLDRSNGGVNALAVMGTDLYAAGSFWSYGNIARWNGSSWSPLGLGLRDYDREPNDAHVNALAVIGTQLYAGGRFWYAGGIPVNHMARWNGSSWSALRGGVDENEVQALAASGGDLYVGGGFTGADGTIVRNLAKWSGSTWSGVGPALYTREWFSIRALASNGSDLFAAVQHGERTRPDSWFTIEKWDGSSWSRIGSLGDEYWHHANVMAVDVADLYVGGAFSSVNGISVNNIAKWDGSTWSGLGSGVDGEVHALAVSGTDLYLGGYGLRTASGVVVNGIAKWDGSNWFALGAGVGSTLPWSNGEVFALATGGGNLYAGGLFDSAGGVSANNIARWDGSSWSALGSGVSGVGSLAVMGTDLYAGAVETAGGVTVNGVARWDGSAWSSVGSGIEMPDPRWSLIVEAAVVVGTDLYIGGGFISAGGAPARYVARWDGTSWSSLGSGVSGPVTALAADTQGHLFVGGSFTLAGNTVSPCIAQVDITGLDFDWGEITSPQVAGTPFPVTLTARNAAGEVLTSHTDPLTLSGYIPVTLGTNVTLGTGTNTWDYPINSRFHDARTQVICLADEIGPACTITSLSLEVLSPPGQTLENWTIRLLHTDRSEFPSSGNWWGGDWTVVYQADEPAGTTGWRTFAFSTPFAYNGKDSLLVDFSFNNSTYSSPGQCRSTQTEYFRSNTFATDSAYGDPLDYGTIDPRPVPSQRVPNILLGTTNPGMVPVAVSPVVTGPFVDGVWTGTVTVAEACAGAILRANDGLGHEGESNPFDVEVATLPMSLVLGDDPLGYPGGAYGFEVQAPSGQVVVIEASTNLVTWRPVHTNLTGDLAQFMFYDRQTGLYPRRFYRASLYEGALPPPQLLTGGFGSWESGFGLTVGAVGGQEVVVEASTNLVVWQPILTNTASVGPLYLYDPDMTNYSHRFYRAVTP